MTKGPSLHWTSVLLLLSQGLAPPLTSSLCLSHKLSYFFYPAPYTISVCSTDRCCLDSFLWPVFLDLIPESSICMCDCASHWSPPTPLLPVIMHLQPPLLPLLAPHSPPLSLQRQRLNPRITDFCAKKTITTQTAWGERWVVESEGFRILPVKTSLNRRPSWWPLIDQGISGKLVCLQRTLGSCDWSSKQSGVEEPYTDLICFLSLKRRCFANTVIGSDTLSN